MTALTTSIPAGAVTQLLGDPFADAMRSGAAWVMAATLGWWVNVPSIDLATSPAATIRGYILWIAAAVATAGLIWQAIVLMLSRQPEPLLTMARGLFTLVLWAGIGIAGPAAAMRAGDAFSTWVLLQAAHGHPAERLQALAGLTGVDSTGAVIVLGLLLILAGLVQAIIMIFREGAVVVLAGVVVLAASGSMTAGTRGWLPRVLSWMVALIAYKPLAALVLATAVVMMGDGQDPRTVLVGLTMLLLSIVALPALMRFFSWTTSGIASGGAGMAVLGASASAASTAAGLYAFRSGGAAGQASHLRDDLGPSAAPPSGPTGGSSEPSPGSPSGPLGSAPTGGAAGAGAGGGATGAAASGGPGAAAAGAAGSTGAAASGVAAGSGTAAAAAGATATGAVPVGAALAVLAAGQAVVSGAAQAASAAADQVTGQDHG